MSRVDTSTAPLDAAPRGHAAANGRPAGQGDLLLYAVITGLVAVAWWFSRRGWFEAGDDVGYWLGVAGGMAMLLLFSYPLRKHVKALHRWGKTKWWLLAHMVLGIGGPLLILLHSTFRVGSINAAVALYSMLIVAGSGIVGRFLYVRVHGGLMGVAQTLSHLRARLGLDRADVHSKLAFAPEVETRLRAFEQRELASTRGPWAFVRQLFLPVPAWWAWRDCCARLEVPLAALARAKGWSDAEHARQQRLAHRWLRHYLRGVVAVAQFSAYERLFALWHVAHVPFVYLLLLSAIAHVIAVHAY